ncbi:MAG: hypothetical protein O3A29_19895 [Planctomycetota bacterium]|nr:hypothetical protein [Planctomycetota bacterium]
MNQIFELERKLDNFDDTAGFRRHLDRLKDAFAEEGLTSPTPNGGQARITIVFEDPIGQVFKETRTDLDATIAGISTDNLVVVEVIKPIIRASFEDGTSKIVQKGIVIVESPKDREQHE